MAQKKAFEVDGWLKRPDPAFFLVLLYGPDRGLVSERARVFATATGLPLDDPFSVVKLDAADVERDAGRLVEEARTVPMFAARRLIWLRNAGGQKGLADDVKTLVADPPRDTIVLIEAGDLKKGIGLRAMVEAGAGAMALPCYGDEARDLDAVIDGELTSAGLTITLDARQALRASLGGDRMASRGEIEKLVLYVAGGREITIDDVRAMTGDVSMLSADDALDALLEGRIDMFDAIFARLTQAGGQVYPILAAALRQFQSLHAMRGIMEGGNGTAGSVVAAHRPPVFFARRKLVEAALQQWTTDAGSRALEKIRSAILQTRRRPELAVSITRQALLAIAIEGGRKRNSS